MILVRLHIYGKVPITYHNNQKIKEVAAREEWRRTNDTQKEARRFPTFLDA